MQLTCSHCGTAIGAADVDLASGFARCTSCNDVFSFRDVVTTASSSSFSSSSSSLTREQVGLPERIDVKHGDPLVISWSWRATARSSPAMSIVFLVFWFGFLVMWNVATLSVGAWQMSLFSLIHVIVGVALGLSVARTMFNTTELKVDRANLTVAIGPVPTKGSFSVPSSTLAQLFVVAKEHHHKGRRWKTFDVMARTRDGRELTVVGKLDNDRHAAFIEQQVEKKLGITDRRVDGEHAVR
jgi:hypothetical protein